MDRQNKSEPGSEESADPATEAVKTASGDAILIADAIYSLAEAIKEHAASVNKLAAAGEGDFEEPDPLEHMGM